MKLEINHKIKIGKNLEYAETKTHFEQFLGK